jgi:hypothetical protein
MHNMDALAPFFGGVKELARKERRFPLGKNPNERPPAACRNLSAGLLQKLFFNALPCGSIAAYSSPFNSNSTSLAACSC